MQSTTHDGREAVVMAAAQTVASSHGGVLRALRQAIAEIRRARALADRDETAARTATANRAAHTRRGHVFPLWARAGGILLLVILSSVTYLPAAQALGLGELESLLMTAALTGIDVGLVACICFALRMDRSDPMRRTWIRCVAALTAAFVGATGLMRFAKYQQDVAGNTYGSLPPLALATAITLVSVILLALTVWLVGFHDSDHSELLGRERATALAARRSADHAGNLVAAAERMAAEIHSAVLEAAGAARAAMSQDGLAPAGVDEVTRGITEHLGVGDALREPSLIGPGPTHVAAGGRPAGDRV